MTFSDQCVRLSVPNLHAQHGREQTGVASDRVWSEEGRWLAASINQCHALEPALVERHAAEILSSLQSVSAYTPGELKWKCFI